jgi:hypothetical protein
MTLKSGKDALKRGQAVWLLATAIAAVMVSGATAMAESTPLATGPGYRIYRSHVRWLDDCAIAPSAASGQPEYRIYRSHVGWRNGEVAERQASDTPTGQTWQLFTSHVDHYDTCSLHPITMSAP